MYYYSGVRNSWNRVVAATMLGIFALQISGCQSIFAKSPVSQGFQALLDTLESESASSDEPSAELKWARQLRASLEVADKLLDSELEFGEAAATDPEGATRFIQKHHSEITPYLKRLEEGSSVFRQVIFETTKHAFETDDPQVKAKDNAIALFALEFQHIYHRKAAELLSPYMVYTAIEGIRDLPEAKTLNQELNESYFRHFGAQIVSQRDKHTVLSGLKAMKDAGTLPKAVDEAIDLAQQGLAIQNQDEAAAMKALIAQLDLAGKSKLQETIRNLTKQFDEVSFLYSPEHNLNPLLNLLVVIGNLTWGLCNTLIGVGIIVWTAALSITGLCKFPRFAIARNGRMIYADITGSNPLGIYGKMSMGIFEFDNGSSYTFASGHEGAHAIQSAILGPLYIPTVLFTYLISGFDQGFMEDWADAWADI